MIEIDGSYGEGGGAILRTAIGLSVFTQKPIHVYNIRKGRKEPGLKTQHLQGILAAADLCGGKLTGAELGSTEISFFPKENFAEKVKIRVETAGSVGLILQALQVAALKAENPVKVEIFGGATYGKWAPPIDFVSNVTYRILESLGYEIELNIEKHGFYPKGGARVSAIFHPTKEISGIELVDPGKIISAGGISVASNHLEEKKVAERQKISARQELFNKLHVSANIKTEYFETESIGSAITLWLKTEKNAILGAANIGEQKLRAEIVGKDVSQSLIADFSSRASIDSHSLDQIIPFLAISQKRSELKLAKMTSHADTNIWVCEKFFGKIFNIKSNILERQILA